MVLSAAAVLGSGACGGANGSHASGYCAILPDAIGLYVGNPVTQMGLEIGTVNRLIPSPTSVQVDFSVTATRPLPNDVKAVIRSTSILADRALELVGNYKSGPKLQPGQCVPLGRSVTPKSLSEVIQSANTFVKGITPQNSTNLRDTISALDRATHNTGTGVNQILSASSRLLDDPDQSISDLKSIVFNMATLTTMLIQTREPMKQIINDAVVTTPYVSDVGAGAAALLGDPLPSLLTATLDIETHAGDALQLTLDTMSDYLRSIYTPHEMGWVSALGGILKSVPWWINAVANHYNNEAYFPLFYRPPMYRIRTPNGPLVCTIMNNSNPGSCANVAGQPYGVDINLLQYVFMEANR